MKRKNYDLTTATVRRRLKPRKEPYWTSLGKCLALGYYAGAGTWIVRRRIDGEYKFESIGIADDKNVKSGLTYSDAVKRASDISSAVAVGTHRQTVQDAIDAYLDGFEGRSKADAESRLTSHPLASKKLDKLVGLDVRRWRDGMVSRDLEDEPLRKSRATANRNLTALKAALNFAVEHGMTKNRDFQIVKPFKNVDQPKMRHLNADESFAFLANCNSPQLRDLCEAALLTGGRFGELATLRVRDFDSIQQTVRLSGSKTESPRVVALNDDGLRLIRRRARCSAANDFLLTNTSGKPWGKSQYSYGVRKAWQRAKIEPVSFHDLRATYGSWLAAAGVPLLNIAKALGHKDLRITSKHYAHLVDQDQHAIIRASLPKLKRTA